MIYDIENLPIRLAEVRKNSNVSLKKLSDEIGFSESTINSYENGKRIPRMYYILTFCNFFGITLEQLFHGGVE